MDQSFNLPNMYQSRANALPGRGGRFDTVYAGGQNGNMTAPWQADADALPYWSRDQNGRAVHNIVDSYAAGARSLPDQYGRQLQLGGTSGSMMRQVHFVRGVGATGINPRAFGTGIRGLRGLGTTGNWYENPWYLGAGAAAIVGAVYLLTRKKGRR